VDVRLVVFGASGRTGAAVVDRALADGHEVVAAVRRPDAVPVRGQLLIRRCDVLDAAAVTAAISRGDAVISAFGPANNRKPGTLISAGISNIVAACVTGGTRRLVFESGLLVGDGRELSAGGRMAIRMAGAFLPELRADKRRAEAEITASPLEWVIVRPPNLTRSAASTRCIAAPAGRISPAKAISFSDCAAALLKGALTPGWVRQVVNVGRP
jgi:putative NADH-flavin reductase